MKKKMKGKNEELEQEEMEEEEEEGEEEEKSFLAEDELRKSIAQLEDIAANSTPDSRKEALLSKASYSVLDAEENEELFGLLGGSSENRETLARSMESNFEDDEDLSKAFNVSPAMEAQTQAIVKSLMQIADRVEQDSKRQQEFNLALAKAVAHGGSISLEMKKSLDYVLEVPIEAPRAAGLSGARPLSKSFAAPQGQEPQGPNKHQILKSLQDRHIESLEKGDRQKSSTLRDAIIKFDSTNMIDPQLLEEVKAGLAS